MMRVEAFEMLCLHIYKHPIPPTCIHSNSSSRIPGSTVSISCFVQAALYPTMSTNAFETSTPELPEKTMKAQHADGATTPSTMEAAEGPFFDAARTKKLLRKMDWHLVPFLALLYL